MTMIDGDATKDSDIRAVQRSIGARLRTARTAAGMTQRNLAQLMGVSFQQIQKYESGENGLPASRLHQLCRILGTEPGWLLALDLDPRDTDTAA
jgi:transcriptional regulator with XRE-family HTH domain